MGKTENVCDCICIHEKETTKAIAELNKLNEIYDICEFYKNFSDSTRLKIICILDKVKRMCVCDIAVALNMTKSAISHQLSNLKDCNLVKAEKSGKTVFYSLADDHVKDIIDKGIEHLQEK